MYNNNIYNNNMQNNNMFHKDKTCWQDNMRCDTNNSCPNRKPSIQDWGPRPLVVNISELAEENKNYRTTLWTGCYLQVTLMSIKVGEDIGLEIHPDHDQFIRIEQGEGVIMMGARRERFDFQEKVCEDYAIMIPAGKWHNLINTGCVPLKLYSIYAPPEHPHGTIHKTKEDAQAGEGHCDC